MVNGIIFKVRVNWNASATDSHKSIFKNELKIKYWSALLGPNDEYKPYLRDGIYVPSISKNFKLNVKNTNSNVLNKLHVIITWEDRLKKKKKNIIVWRKKKGSLLIFLFPFFSLFYRHKLLSLVDSNYFESILRAYVKALGYSFFTSNTSFGMRPIVAWMLLNLRLFKLLLLNKMVILQPLLQSLLLVLNSTRKN